MNLKVVSFNIRCCDDKNGHSIKERAPRLYSAIDELSPDVIGLQEYTPLWEEPIASFFGKEYCIFNKYRTETKELESSPILWKKDKFDLCGSGYFWLSNTPEKESRGWDSIGCYRMCVFCRFKDKVEGREFVFFNTHFGFSDSCQKKSAKLIKKRMTQFSSLPTFITGDFNMIPDSVGYMEMTSFLSDANALASNDKRATYHGYAPEENKGERIDYCFVNGKVKALSQRLIDRTFDGKYPSDHFGLETVLEI